MSDTPVQETKPKVENTTPKITSHVKEKDPRRVEAGRKLGAISKAAKERKAQERKRKDRKESVRSISSESDDDEKISKSEQNDHTMLYLTAAGVIVGIIGLYFTYKTESEEHHQPPRYRRSAPEQEPPPETSVPPPPQPQPTPSHLRSFD